MIFPLFLSAILATANYPITLDSSTQNNTETINNTHRLECSVSINQNLPEEFYGMWSVTSTLLETNSPYLFNKKTSDIWVLKRENNQITLSNPVTGASSSITIEEVEGKTAIFSRKKETPFLIETETPKITVEGDSFYGTDELILNHYKNGKQYKTNIVKYKIKGTRISGPTSKDIFAR